MLTLDESLLKANCLDATRIQGHQSRILQAIRQSSNTTIPIVDACTLANGGVVAWEKAQTLLQSVTPTPGVPNDARRHHTVSCIPAAGAAARYFLELRKFVRGGENDAHPSLKSLAHAPQFKQFCKELLERYENEPKALIPATVEGDSFLALKIEEQLHLFPCLGNICIVPSGMRGVFETELARQAQALHTPISWHVLEQGTHLSTIRFQLDGTPFVEENGQYSLVSAGHGELLHLFDDILKLYPQTLCLHIRNIDNIIGIHKHQAQELNTLSHAFYYFRTHLEYLRFALMRQVAHKRTLLTDPIAHSTLVSLEKWTTTPTLSKETSTTNTALSAEQVHSVLGSLFHWQPLDSQLTPTQTWSTILRLLQRPLSVMGMVRKEEGDVGGGPVFVQLPNGRKIKLCLEMPRANAHDRQIYFENGGKATHFNPVLAFFEMQINTTPFAEAPEPHGHKVNFAQLFDENFWLLARREYKGKPVCYHETILYELIGNAESTNLVFIEAPRTLFRPHKSYFDSHGHMRVDYKF